MRKLLCLALVAGTALAGEISFAVAGLRVLPREWDKPGNFAKLEQYARQAAARGAQLVVTPEGFLEGYVGNDKKVKDLTREKYFAVGESIDGPLLSKARGLARELNIYLSVGFAERRGERMYNSLAIFSPAGDLALRYSKAHTALDEPFNTQGDELPVVDTPLGRWGTLICFDRQLPETARVLAIKGAQLILVPAWGMYGETNDIMMRTRAYENSVWVVFVHPKRCLVIDPGGKIVAQDAGDEDQLVMATIRLDDRVGRGPIRMRRPELYREILTPPK
jgi:predicted amidohydrolase